MYFGHGQISARSISYEGRIGWGAGARTNTFDPGSAFSASLRLGVFAFHSGSSAIRSPPANATTRVGRGHRTIWLRTRPSASPGC